MYEEEVHEGKIAYNEEETEVIRYEGASILEADLLVEWFGVEWMRLDVREGDKEQKGAEKGGQRRERLFLQE